MLTLEQAIGHAEEVATEQELLMGRYDAASGYARSGNESIRTESAKECEKCAGEHRQLAAYLRELQERRKAPKIVRCRECAFCRPFLSSKTCSLGLLHTINPDIDFCSRAVRRTE